MKNDQSLKKPLALYIHWPFCLSKCPYCDFNSHVQDSIDHEFWQRAFLREIENYRSLLASSHIRSVFFGGGTPSLMPASLVAKILESLDNISGLSGAEITLEVNPTSAETEKLKRFAAAGVNRLSIGVQSLKQQDLQFLGRTHDTQQAKQAIEMAAKYFDNYSFDLIYARPAQTLEEWHEELEQAVAMSVGHLSLYQLTIEKGTPFFLLHKNKSFTLPDAELASAMYNLTREVLTSHGYSQYEISNYARPGKQSRHNLSYWRYDEYLGLGPGAHSRLARDGLVRAITMYYQPQKWLDRVLEHGSGVQHDLALSKEEIKTEIIMMGLRLNDGIDDTKLIKYLGSTFQQLIPADVLLNLQQLGLLEVSDNRLKLTQPGLLLHNAVVAKML